MKKYNLIVVYNHTMERLLFCRRRKDPYKGLSNFVGGKIEPGEASEDAAYRELEEETGITRQGIQLVHLMDFTYFVTDCSVEVYVGRLDRELPVAGDENDLYWSSLDHDFFSPQQYAGNGNIGHILLEIEGVKEQIFARQEG